jgi:acetolactate synthase I/II/III large subunit
MIDRPDAPPHVIRIDIDPEEMRRLVPHAGIIADAADGTRALTARLRELVGGAAAPRADIAEARRAARTAIGKVQPQLAYLDVIRAALPREGIVVGELSQVGFTSYFGYPVLAPRTYISEGFQGTLGFGFQTALGVKAAHPDTPVISLTGDGGFMFGVQELATARQYGLGLITLLFNNRAYGNVMRDQRERFGNRIIGATLTNPDFMDLAKAFGVVGHRVASPDALAALLPKLLSTREPVLVEIEVPEGAETSPWEFIHARL